MSSGLDFQSFWTQFAAVSNISVSWCYLTQEKYFRLLSLVWIYFARFISGCIDYHLISSSMEFLDFACFISGCIEGEDNYHGVEISSCDFVFFGWAAEGEAPNISWGWNLVMLQHMTKNRQHRCQLRDFLPKQLHKFLAIVLSPNYAHQFAWTQAATSSRDSFQFVRNCSQQCHEARVRKKIADNLNAVIMGVGFEKRQREKRAHCASV
jgi:hypothetical protein